MLEAFSDRFLATVSIAGTNVIERRLVDLCDMSSAYFSA
jgi:hypothetical protein